MIRLTHPTLVLLLVALASGSTPVEAEQDGGPWTGLNTNGLQTVFVRDAEGVEVSGKLLELTPEALVLLTGDTQRRFERNDIARIQTRDGLKNGAVIGALVGVGMGLLSAGISDCPYDADNGCGGMRLVIVGISTGVYAGLGTGIDWLVRGRTTIYSASARSGVSTATAARPSLSVALSW
jgi:hypothetical protein